MAEIRAHHEQRSGERAAKLCRKVFRAGKSFHVKNVHTIPPL
jgi:hypothetical protein